MVGLSPLFAECIRTGYFWASCAHNLVFLTNYVSPIPAAAYLTVAIVFECCCHGAKRSLSQPLYDTSSEAPFPLTNTKKILQYYSMLLKYRFSKERSVLTEFMPFRCAHLSLSRVSTIYLGCIRASRSSRRPARG